MGHSEKHCVFGMISALLDTPKPLVCNQMGGGEHSEVGDNLELKNAIHRSDDTLEMIALVDGGLSSSSMEKRPFVDSLHRNHSFRKEEHECARIPGCCDSTVRRGGWVRKLPVYILRSMHHVVFGTKLNFLLLCIPLAMVAYHLHLKHGWIFLLSLLGMAPLAERLGFVTEQLSFFTGSTVGGLLNATFGNATEMIICIMALRKNMIHVVQLSLLGSILSNMLLVLGCAFFFGGLAHPKYQKFNKASAQVSSSLLLMAVMGLLFPAALNATHTELHKGTSELVLSRFSSIVMLIAYAAYLYFQLKSHKDLYDEPQEAELETGVNDVASDSEECLLSFWASIAWLTVLTVFISILSEYLVDAIEFDPKASYGDICDMLNRHIIHNSHIAAGASASWNIPITFISVVILPIVGNAAEHASAIMFALKDKLDISLGVAIGSSTQISMFVIPFCVVIGWPMGTEMDLNFHLFETACLFITVLVVAFMLQDGTANYFKGLMLVLCYLIVAASFCVHMDPRDPHPGS